MFYSNGSDTKKSAKKIDIETTDGKSPMVKAVEPKNSTLMTLSAQVQLKLNDKVPRQTLLWQNPTFKNPTIKIFFKRMTFIGYLKHVSC